MRREDVVAVLEKIPPNDHPKVVFVLKGGVNAITLDTFMRHEATYAVIRGREAGTTDEGRGFFLPYDEISYVRLERLVRLNEIRVMYGEAKVNTGTLSEAHDDAEDAANLATAAAEAPKPAAPTVVVPVQSAPLDPAAIAKANLLERIRSARTNAGKPAAG